ncbi:MAG: hypothetical protein V7708_17740 [Oceanicoccus sp.]
MAKLLVQVSTTDADFSIYRKTIIASLKNILDKAEAEVMVLVVYQSEGAGRPEDSLFSDSRVDLQLTSNFNVSAARNAGLSFARSKDIDYVVFQDTSISVSDGFIQLINIVVAQKIGIAKGNVQWGSSFSHNPEEELVLSEKCVSPIFDAYVWSYIFSLEALDGLTFNEQLGPGRYTAVKAGEDVIFLYLLFGRKFSFSVTYSVAAKVYHPARPSDNSKHLEYAEAQGILVRRLLSENCLNLNLLSYCLAFFGNAVFRAIIGKPNSSAILHRRIQGFIDVKGKRKLIP